MASVGEVFEKDQDMKNIAQKTIIAATAALVALSMAACNTIAGAGEDIESVGGAIEKTADDQN